MFGGKQPNPYDEFVTKTTDENLTSENWELIMNLCDKVNDEGEQGARNVIAALLKRLAHRNPSVQLYALALAEALSKNCGVELHREIASRAFTQGLEKLVTDRMSHEKVKRRALHLISLWSGEFENNPQLGLMEELYSNLKSKNYKFDEVSEPPPRDVDDEIRRKEEEELQRVLEMSVHDKGGRNVNAWKDANASSGAGVSGSSTRLPGPSSSGGYTPTEPPSSAYPASETHHHSKPQSAPSVPSPTAPAPAQQSPPASAEPSTSASGNISRVRALYTFEPTVAGELAFEKGEIIKVTDRAYDNWWRGQLRGRTGIFPVNYVEPLPDPTPGELAREAEQEAAVFAQAANIDKLIDMLRSLDPSKDNLADNEEIQEIYRSSMSLRPKIVKLIDKYSQKRAELVAMNDNFVKARAVFEQMMEESLARHTGVYDNTQPTFRSPRPDSRNNADYRASTYGWNPALHDQPGYNAYPAAPAAYAGGEQQRPQQQQPYNAQAYGEANAYPGHHHPSSYGGQPQPYPPGDSYGQQQPAAQAQTAQLAQPYPGDAYSQQQPAAQAQAAQPSQPYPPGDSYVQQQPAAQAQAAQPSPYPPGDSYGQQQPAAQMQAAQPSQQYAHVTVGPEHTQSYGHGQTPMDPATHVQQQPQTQSQAETQQSQPQPAQIQEQQGPPYVYDSNKQYADPNVQAWAQYYAQGGKDPAGAVYFTSVPGVTDAPGQSSVPPTSEHPAQPAETQTLPPNEAQPLGQPSTQAQSSYPANTSDAAQSTSPPGDYTQHPAQSAYQTYGSAIPSQAASLPADQAQLPHLGIQLENQPSSNAILAGQNAASNVAATGPYGPSASVGTQQPYAPATYLTSPTRDVPSGYQPQLQYMGTQKEQAPALQERIGS